MRTLFLTTAAFAVLVMVAPVGNAHAAPLPCPDDGRLKGVEIGSPLFRQTVYALPGHACVTSGPNGVFVVRPDGLKKIGK
jgi:hypothetical protein